MKIHYDIEKLNKIAEDIFALWRLGVLFADSDGKTLTKCFDPTDFCSAVQAKSEEVHSGCCKSDADLIANCRACGQSCMHICHMNLCDVALPITKNGIQVAYVLLGRMRGTSCNQAPIGSSPELTKLYYERPFFTDRELESLKSLLSLVLFSGAITFEEPDVFTKIKAYIEENLANSLSLSAVCRRFFISKNTLYQLFREECGCTFGEYVAKQRTQKAQKLLAETDKTVLAIGEELGFASYAYFCRFFKKTVGVTPSEYRNFAK